MDKEKIAQERDATSMGYACFNAIFIIMALGCMLYEEHSLAAVVLVADLAIFVVYLCMMALWKKGW